MARTFVSPMGDPTFSAAAQNLADALFPSARTQAAIKMAGAQYQGQLGNNRQTELENVGLERSNSAYDTLGDVITDPQQLAILRAGGGKADNLADALGKFQEQRFRQGARDAAAGGNYTGANAELFGVASGPQQLPDVVGGYYMGNRFQENAPIVATGKTLAEIVAEQALAGQRNAAAALDTDKRLYPERHRANGSGKVADISPSEAKALDDLIGNYLPSITAGQGKDAESLPAEIDPGLRNEILTRASQLYRDSGNAQASVAQAFSELAQQEQAGAKPVEAVDNWDLWGMGTPDVEAQPAKPYKFSRRAPAAAPAAGRTVRRTGTYNGRRVVQYSDGTVEYAN